MQAKVFVSAVENNRIRAQALADDAVVIEVTLPRPIMAKVCGATTVFGMVGAFAGKPAAELTNEIVRCCKQVVDGAPSAEKILGAAPAWLRA